LCGGAVSERGAWQVLQRKLENLAEIYTLVTLEHCYEQDLGGI